MKMVENGYLTGKFEKILPFFMLGQTERGSRYSEQKGNLKTTGAYNIVFNRKYVDTAYVRGYIFPIILCSNEEMKDYFLKLQRVVKKNKKRKDFTTIIDNHLKENGFGYLKLSLYSDKDGYISFKINGDIYSKLLSKGFSQLTKVLDGAGKAIEILESKRFQHEKYTDFLEGIYNEENLLKRTIEPFRLIYVFENLTIGQYVNPEDYRLTPFTMAIKNLQNTFNIKDNVTLIDIQNISITNKKYGWIDINIDVGNSKYVLHCSDAFDPFLDIYNWLMLIKMDNRNCSVYVDEEGHTKTIEAYPFDDRLYLVFYDKSNKTIFAEAVVDRDKFIDNFLNVLKTFVLHQFEVNEKEFFWRGEGIFKVINYLEST